MKDTFVRDLFSVSRHLRHHLSVLRGRLRRSPSPLFLGISSLLRLMRGKRGICAVAIAGAILVTLPLATPAHAADSLDTIRERGTIRIGMEGTFVPYAYHDDSGKLVGFEKEIADKVAKDLGVKPIYVETKWDSLIAGMDAGRYDIIINNMAPTNERRKKYIFTQPYAVSQAQIALSHNSDIHSLSDLHGKRAAQTASSNYGQAAVDAGAHLVPVQGFTEAVQLVEDGRADATINDVVTMAAYRNEHPESSIHIIDAPEVESIPASIMAPRASTQLVDRINDSLEKHRKNGDFAAIFTRYVGQDLTPSDSEVAQSRSAESPSSQSRWSRALHLAIDSAPNLLFATIRVTIPLTIISFIIGLILAIITAEARLSSIRVLRGVSWFYVWIFRGTPSLVQLFLIFYGLPSIGVTLNAWMAAIIALSLNTGAYASEAIRSAQLSLPRGQWEAAQALHLSHWHTLRYVIAPQIWRIALPPLSNELINLFKTTSLVSVITLADVFQVSQQITAREFEPMVLYSEVALIYLIICTLLSWGQNALEKRTSRYVAR